MPQGRASLRYLDREIASFEEQVLLCIKEKWRNWKEIEGRPLKLDTLKRKLGKREENREPVFFLFPKGYLPDVELLKALRSVFETPVFFFTANGEKLAGFDQNLRLLNALPPGVEEDIYENYENTVEDTSNI